MSNITKVTAVKAESTHCVYLYWEGKDGLLTDDGYGLVCPEVFGKIFKRAPENIRLSFSLTPFVGAVKVVITNNMYIPKFWVEKGIVGGSYDGLTIYVKIHDASGKKVMTHGKAFMIDCKAGVEGFIITKMDEKNEKGS